MSNIKADVLKLAKGNVYQEHEKFIQTFEKKWRQDENIILIMCAITLFTHDRARTIHSDVIKLEQNSYYYLLRRYVIKNFIYYTNTDIKFSLKIFGECLSRL